MFVERGLGGGRHVGLLVMTLVLLLACVVVAQGLLRYPFRTDELFSVSNMGGFDGPFSPAEIVDSIRVKSPDHAPLFFFLGAAWASLTGWSQFALRSLSLLTSVLMIACVYRCGSGIFDKRTGALAAFMMATSAYLVLHYHDFRMYPLLLLLSIAHCWFYWRLTAGKKTGRLDWALFVLSAVALIYTHTFSVSLFAGLAAHNLLFSRKMTVWKGWALAALVYAPYLPTTASALLIASETDKVTSVAGSVAGLVLSFGHLLTNGERVILVLFALPWAYSVVVRRDRALIRFMVIPLATLATLLILNALVGLIPLSRMRYLILLWFPTVLILARGISWAPRWKWLAAVCVIAWSIAGLNFYRSDAVLGFVGGMPKTRDYPPMENYVRQLEGRTRPQDYLLGFSRRPYINHDHRKHNRSVSDFYTQVRLGIDGAFVRDKAVGTWLYEEMRMRIEGNPYLLFAIEPQNKPWDTSVAYLYLETYYRACGVVVDEPSLYVRRYVLKAMDCEREYERIEYANGIVAVDRFAEYIEEESLLRVLVGWEIPDESLLQELNVSFQAFGSSQEKVAHEDFHLFEFGRRKWNTVELSTADIGPGEYRLVMVLYGRGDGTRVEGLDLSTGAAGEILPILSFRVGVEGDEYAAPRRSYKGLG